jgi:hypothetical protein
MRCYMLFTAGSISFSLTNASPSGDFHHFYGTSEVANIFQRATSYLPMPTEEELASIFVLFAVRLLIHGISEVGRACKKGGSSVKSYMRNRERHHA